MTTALNRSLTAEVMALAEAASPRLSTKAAVRLGQLLGEYGAKAVLDADVADDDGVAWLRSLFPLEDSRVEHWERELERLGERGINVLVAGSANYPANLSLVHNRPPVLFIRGSLSDVDRRAVAVVGTRQVTAAGQDLTRQISEQLSLNGVTIVSGLAAGVDTVAHQAALDCGGRTIAVFGTGIERVFPKQNAALAASVTEHGACVSQFWPSQSGERWTFPLRNIITSGLSLGTVVIEAGETSGARLQAQEAVAHGRRLFLPETLVEQQKWAQELLGLPSVTVVRQVEDVLGVLQSDLAVAETSVF